MIAARTFGHAAYLSLYEFFERYTPREYLIAWVPRIVVQLAFFALVAAFVGGSDLRTFVLIGNSAQISVHAVLVFATQSVGRELWGGTMVLLLATPARTIIVLMGRGLAEIGNGVLTAGIGLAVSLAAMQIPVDAGRLIGSGLILLTIAVSSYGMAMLIGSAALRFPQFQNAASNLAGLAMAVLCGVNVPVSFLAEPVQAVSAVLPLTHGLAALRVLLAGADADVVLGSLGLEVLIGVAYYALAHLSFMHFLARARARGTLDFH